MSYVSKERKKRQRQHTRSKSLVGWKPADNYKIFLDESLPTEAELCIRIDEQLQKIEIMLINVATSCARDDEQKNGNLQIL